MSVEANPTAGLQIATCELGYPTYPATVLNDLGINISCMMCGPMPPYLTGVTVLGPSAILAQFDQCVKDGMPPSSFVLRNKANALDSIIVSGATRVGSTAYDLALQSPMIDSTTYTLLTEWAIWDCTEVYPNRSQLDFTFLEAAPVERTSWGAIKSLYGG